MKLLELFSGVGSFSLGMSRNGIDHEIVGYSDIRNSAVKLFCKLHNMTEEQNLGDVKNVNAKGMNVDIITYGSPCQSFTRAGKGEGGEKGSDTKSSLMWETVRIVGECNPKIVIWENVPDAVNKKNIGNFINYTDELEEMGYNSYYKVINANKNGSAQKRSRLFCVSIRKDVDDHKFKFIEDSNDPVKDLSFYLVDKGIQGFDVEEKIQQALILGEDGDKLKIRNATISGYALAEEGDIVDTGFYNSKTRRGRVQNSACPTLLRSKTISVIENGRLRYLTPKEYWLLQEMPIELYDHVESCDYSLSEAYDVVGGVINQKHMDVLFKSLKLWLDNNNKF